MEAGVRPRSAYGTERNGCVLHERRALTDSGRRVRKDVTLAGPNGEERRWHEDVRLFDLGDIEALLGRHGLRVLRSEGDFDGSATAPDAPRLIVWGERSG